MNRSQSSGSLARPQLVTRLHLRQEVFPILCYSSERGAAHHELRSNSATVPFRRRSSWRHGIACSMGEPVKAGRSGTRHLSATAKGLMASLPISAILRGFCSDARIRVPSTLAEGTRRPTGAVSRRPSRRTQTSEPIRIARKHLGQWADHFFRPDATESVGGHSDDPAPIRLLGASNRGARFSRLAHHGGRPAPRSIAAGSKLRVPQPATQPIRVQRPRSADQDQPSDPSVRDKDARVCSARDRRWGLMLACRAPGRWTGIVALLAEEREVSDPAAI